MTAIDRTAYPRPGTRLTREELEARYDLTETELAMIGMGARGETGRLMLAVLLKTRQDFALLNCIFCSDAPQSPTTVGTLRAGKFSSSTSADIGNIVAC